MKLWHFGCGGREHTYGENAAFSLSTKGTNMFMFDVNKTATRVMRHLCILKKANVSQMILSVSHLHWDHLNAASWHSLKVLARENKTKLSLMMSGFQKHDNEVLSAIKNFDGGGASSLATLTKAEVSDMMKWHKIETDQIQHDRFERYNYADKSRTFEHCVGLRIYNKNGYFTAYGVDHCDRDYVRNIVSDPKMVRFYTDANDKTKAESQNHMSLEELNLLVPSYKRKKVTCVHIPFGAQKLARGMGFNTAIPTMAVLDPIFAKPDETLPDFSENLRTACKIALMGE